MAFEIAGVGLFGLAQHPFLTYPASLGVLQRLRPRPVAGEAVLPARTSRVAVCVCAYDEEEVIQAKVENLLALRQSVPQLEILFYVDAATDRTAEILRGYGDAIRLLVSPERHGKTHGMNCLVGMSDAEFVVFTDANVTFAPDTLRNLLRPFADREVGCVCGHLICLGAEGSATAAIGSLYWRMEEKIKSLESATGSVMGADGSIFAIRRSLHHAPPADIIDDMAVSLSILCDGHRIVCAPDAIAYESIVSRPGEAFRRKIRIACQAFNVHRMLRPRLRVLSLLDRYKYASHKLLRWMTAYSVVGGGALVATGLAAEGYWWGLLIMLAILSGLLCLAGLRPKSIARKLLDLAGAFVATGVGVWRSLQGERFQTWSPPQSDRRAA
jgi:cellulose synthase/poly-beta-1,6-N-acetylglucosamine synthase-like glycosyltransferase